MKYPTPQLRPATDQDRDFLIDLNRQVYEDLVVEQFGAWDARAEEQKFDQKWQARQYRIIELEGQRIGALWTRQEADHIWLREIQIVPARQNQGIGSALILVLMNEAKQSNLPLRLRVLTANRAKALYERLGFRVTGSHKDSHYWMVYTPLHKIVTD